MTRPTVGRLWPPTVALDLYPDDRLGGIKRDLSAAAYAVQERLRSGSVSRRKVEAYRAAETTLLESQGPLRTVVRCALDSEEINRFCEADQAKQNALSIARSQALALAEAESKLRRARRWQERASAKDAARAARRANGKSLASAERANRALREITVRFQDRLGPAQQDAIKARREAARNFIEAAQRVIAARDTRCLVRAAASTSAGGRA